MGSLKFARQFVSSRTVAAGSAAPVGAVADLPQMKKSLSNPSAKAGVGNLQNMSEKNREVMRMLQEKVMDRKMDEQEERTRMSKEIRQISAAMVSAKEDTTKTIDEIKNEMQQAMAASFEKWRTESMQQQADKMAALEAEVERWQVKAKQADDEAVALRIKLASSEERVKYVNQRIEELQDDRQKVEDERKSIRSEKEQQWERLNTAERELFKAKADAEVQRGEVERLMTAKAADVGNSIPFVALMRGIYEVLLMPWTASRTDEEAFRAENLQWRSKKTFFEDSVKKQKEAWHQEKLQLEKEVSSLRQGEHSAKVLQLEEADGEETSQLQSRITRLEAESHMLSQKLVQASDARERLEAEVDQIRQQSTEEVQGAREQ